MKRIERLHALSEMLRRSGSRGCTAEHLAAELGVSVRTIKRDIDALENSGAAVWARPGPRGGYGLLAQDTLPPVSLTSAQAVALLTAVSAASDAPYADLAHVAVRRILEVLDPVTRARADDLAGRIWVDRERDGTRAVRSALEDAMSEQRVVRMRYRTESGTESVRDVEPVIFASRGGRWYVIGWCRLRDEMRWFRMDRVIRAHVTQTECRGHDVSEIGEPPPSSRPVVVRDSR